MRCTIWFSSLNLPLIFFSLPSFLVLFYLICLSSCIARFPNTVSFLPPFLSLSFHLFFPSIPSFISFPSVLSFPSIISFSSVHPSFPSIPSFHSFPSVFSFPSSLSFPSLSPASHGRARQCCNTKEITLLCLGKESRRWRAAGTTGGVSFCVTSVGAEGGAVQGRNKCRGAAPRTPGHPGGPHLHLCYLPRAISRRPSCFPLCVITSLFSLPLPAPRPAHASSSRASGRK